MKKLFTLLSAVLLVFPLKSFAGDELEFYNWAFGKNAHVRFNADGTKPEFVSGTQMSVFEGCSSISDSTGTLLLYTNGVSVWNRQGQLLNPFDNLNGHDNSTHSAQIIKKPGNNKLYYIFTTDAGSYIDPPNLGFQYSVVDMNLNGGAGGIAELNVPLLSPACEKIALTKHSNGTDIWVAGREFGGNGLYAWLLTENGISDTVVTNIGCTPDSVFNSIGQMKFSPDGKTLALAGFYMDTLEIFSFDNETGEFSDFRPVVISETKRNYGIEFSADGTDIFMSRAANDDEPFEIFRYRISPTATGDEIKATEEKLLTLNYEIGSLQLGVDGRIYFSGPRNWLGAIIYDPLISGDYYINEDFVSLEFTEGRKGLPVYLHDYENLNSIYICEFENAALNPGNLLLDTVKFASTYFWTGPNGFFSDEAEPVIENFSLADEGIYKLKVTYEIAGENVEFERQLDIKVFEDLDLNIEAQDSVICQGSRMLIFGNISEDDYDYEWWYDGDTISTEQQVFIEKGGKYELILRTPNGCTYYAEKEFRVVPVPEAKIIGDEVLCEGETIELKAGLTEPEFEYHWSTGDTVPVITVDKGGTYKLMVTSKFGCEPDSTEITVSEFADFEVVIEGPDVICSENPAPLTAKTIPDYPDSVLTFLWSNGSTKRTIISSNSGLHTVKVTYKGKCDKSAEKQIIKSGNPVLKLNYSDTTRLCEGESITVSIIGPKDNLEYYWTDDYEFPERQLSESGTYSMVAENSDGCTDTAHVTVVVHEKPEVNVITEGASVICQGEEILLRADTTYEGMKYFWNSEEGGPDILVNSGGIYTLTVESVFGCRDTSTMVVKEISELEVDILGKKAACKGESIELKVIVGGSANAGLLWSTGETGESITVDSSGKYYVEAVSSSGCSGRDSIEVEFIDYPEFEQDYYEFEFCEGKSHQFSPGGLNPDYSYFWSDGEAGTERTFTEAGTYELIATNRGRCSDTLHVEISVAELPEFELTATKTEICSGDTTEISIVNPIDGTIYTWPDGSEGTSFKAVKADIYRVSAMNEAGCEGFAEIDISISDAVDFIIMSDKKYICEGESAILSPDMDFAEYLWDNGSTSKTRTVSQTGIYSLEVKDRNGCTGYAEIEIKSFSTSLEHSVREITIEAFCGETAEFDFEITNSGSTEITVDNIQLLNSIAGLEISNKSGLPGKMQADETRVIGLKYLSSENTAISGNLQITISEPCEAEIIIPVKIRNKYRASIRMPEIKLAAGDSLCLPVFAELLCEFPEFYQGSLEFEMTFEKNYFYPYDISRGKIISMDVSGDLMHVVVKIDNITLTREESEITRVCGVALIGGYERSNLSVANAVFVPETEMQLTSGWLEVGSCVAPLRGLRLFNPNELIISPNPAGSKVRLDIYSEEKGNHDIIIFTIEGKEIFSSSWEVSENSPPEKRVSIDTGNLPRGIYFVKYKTPWNQITRKISIVK